MRSSLGAIPMYWIRVAPLFLHWRTSLSENRHPPSPSQGHAFPGHALAREHAAMQARDRVERGQERALLPAAQIGGMLAGEQDASIERAQVLVVARARRVGPAAAAAEHGGITVPGDRDAVLELLAILRMDLRTVGDRLGDPLGRRERRELEGINAGERIGAEQHRLAGRS